MSGNYGNNDILEQKMCEEIRAIEKKYESRNGEMDEVDVKRLDLLYHTLKSKATYEAMKDADEYGYSDGRMSGRTMPRMSGHYPDPQWYPYTRPYPENDGYMPRR